MATKQSTSKLFSWNYPQESPGSPKTTTGKTIPKLFQPIKIRNLNLKNRIVVSPMCQYSAEDGMFSDWQLVELGSFAVGGAGLIFTEATAVESIGRISPHCTGIWDDKHIVPLKRIADFIHAHHAAMGIQLAHAGRKGSTYPLWVAGRVAVPISEGGWTPIAPSPIIFESNFPIPQEMTKADIERVKTKFVEAAERAEKSNIDVIEIHAAHGYLIHEFYSPITNKRQDEYGGSFEGRIRLCVEIVQAVRNVWPAYKPLFVRLSCVDWVPGGWDLSETIQLVKILKNIGVDVIDCTSGGNHPSQQIKVKPGYQVPFSSAIRTQTEILTTAVGLIYNSDQAEEILQKGEADLIAMAREFLRNPHWPLKAASELNVDVNWSFQYQRGKRSKL